MSALRADNNSPKGSASIHTGYFEPVVVVILIRHAQHGQIFKIGPGYSTCAITDKNERLFSGGIGTICIKPYPKLLLSLVKATDQEFAKEGQFHDELVAIHKNRAFLPRLCWLPSPAELWPAESQNVTGWRRKVRADIQAIWDKRLARRIKKNPAR